MNQDFATIGQQVKAKTGAYKDLPDEVVGQAYLKKTNPLQYEIYKSQVNNIGDIQKAQATSEIQANKELQVNAEKNKQNYEFDQTHPKALTPSEQATVEESKAKKEAAAKTKSEALSLIDDLLNRDVGAVTGAKNPLKYLTGEAQYTKSLLDQLQSKLSLDARSLLKGTGQISDKETQMLEESVAALGKNKKGSYTLRNEDLKNELLRIKKNLGGAVSETPDISTKEMSVGGLVKNAGKDVGSVLEGVLNLPKVTTQVGKESLDVPISKLLGVNMSPGIFNLYNSKTAKDVGSGVVNEYKDLATNPIQHAYDKPVSTILDILPFLQAGKTALATKTAKTAETTSEIGKITQAATGIEDAATVSKVSTAIQDIAPKINKVFDKAKGVAPRGFLTKAKVDAYKLYDGVPIDTSSILNSAEEFVKRYPSSATTLEKYRSAIQSANTVEKLDKALGEWSDAFKANKDIKPGINNDLLGTIWKSGRQELATKAPKVAAVKTLMGEMIDVTQAGSKALWKSVLAKLLFGK